MNASVLIPAYQARPYILTALQSVAAQTHTDWEIIVVEDGSHDGTEAVVAAFAATCTQRVVYRNMGINSGVGAVRSRLIDLASGAVLAFLDADDRWKPTHLEMAVECIRQGSDLVASGVQTFDLETGNKLEVVEPPEKLVSDPVLTLFQQSVIITSSSVVLTKALAVRTGQFDTTLRIGEDRDYWLRCALDGAQFARTNAITCEYAKHKGSSMARTTVVAEYELKFYDKYRTLSNVPLRLRRHLLAASLVSVGRLLRHREPARSAAYFWRAWQYEPFNPRIPFHLAYNGWRSVAAETAA
ncbi:MAG TPA: glycosyltransferase family 2 protein [Opitutus sp.]|nr:glycosyltransferase family 2 protein [Opitutus sp.]